MSRNWFLPKNRHRKLLFLTIPPPSRERELFRVFYLYFSGFNNLVNFNAVFVTIDDVQMPETVGTAFDRRLTVLAIKKIIGQETE